MTIKQQGGIFGRNPEFREVTVTDDLRVESGGVFVGGLGADAGDLNIGNLSGHSGIRFGLGGILPTNGGATSNGTKDLGSSGLRWKDIYLSGNVILADGQGIDFSATAGTGTSELFDDYEEGTWTPVYEPTTGAFGTIGAVTSGFYRKVGDTVLFWAEMRTTGTPDLGTASGRLNITGLPFTVTSAGGYGQVSIFQGFNLGTAFTNLGVVADPNTTRLYLTKNSSNSSIVYVQATELSTATSNFGNLLGIFGMYRT